MKVMYLRVFKVTKIISAAFFKKKTLLRVFKVYTIMGGLILNIFLIIKLLPFSNSI